MLKLVNNLHQSYTIPDAKDPQRNETPKQSKRGVKKTTQDTKIQMPKQISCTKETKFQDLATEERRSSADRSISFPNMNTVKHLTPSVGRDQQIHLASDDRQQ